MRKIIKKLFSLVLVACMTSMSAVNCIGEIGVVKSYYLLKYEYKDFVYPLLYAGATENQIVEFFKDIEVKLENTEGINRENFETYFRSALLDVAGYREHLDLSAIILDCYGEEIDEYLQTRQIPQKFVSVYNALLEVLFGNGFADKVELASIYENCKKAYDLGLTNYTEDSVANLKSALDAALTVLENTQATSDEIVTAKDELNRAYAGLANKPTGGGNSPGGGDGAGGGGTSESKPTPPPSVGQDLKPDNSVQFKDLDEKHWSFQAVMSLVERSVVNGFEDNTFRPEQLVTREEYAKLICTAFKLKKSSATIYKDADTDAWYNEYIVAITDNKIMQGTGNGRFGVGKTLTRQDMAVISYRLIANGIVTKTYTDNNNHIPFKDLVDADDYALGAITSMQKIGVINGIGNGLYAPLDGVTRAQAAQIIYSLLSK